jgi:hypothetical protein
VLDKKEGNASYLFGVILDLGELPLILGLSLLLVEGDAEKLVVY